MGSQWRGLRLAMRTLTGRTTCNMVSNMWFRARHELGERSPAARNSNKRHMPTRSLSPEIYSHSHTQTISYSAQPVSDASEQQLARFFAIQAGHKPVLCRHRLPSAHRNEEQLGSCCSHDRFCSAAARAQSALSGLGA